MTGLNTKIAELALKAIDQKYNFFSREKFAELIIDECGEVAACNSHVSGYELKLLFKEHFGIEE